MLSSFFVAGVVMWLLWQGFDPRVAVVFVIVLIAAETFLRLRWRLAIVCSQCGFDPALYLKNSTLAAAKVRARLEERKSSARTLLSKPLDIPVITADRARELEEIQKRVASRPHLLSKTL